MPRSAVQARLRLQHAALELYRDHGYDVTTTAQIAARAGVSERTFFRHFTDKREVLFDGEASLRADLERGVAEAPDGDPLAILLHAFRAAIPLLERNRPFAEPRQKVITTTPALMERALTKEASLAQALSNALQRRGVSKRQASLTAQIGMAAFSQATLAWFEHSERDLEHHLTQTVEDLRAVTSTQGVRRPKPAH